MTTATERFSLNEAINLLDVPMGHLFKALDAHRFGAHRLHKMDEAFLTLEAIVGIEAMVNATPAPVAKPAMNDDVEGAWSAKATAHYWANVERGTDPNGCWEWTGKMTTRDGQGRVNLDPTDDRGRAFAEANRFVWQLFNGRFADPEAVHVVSVCRNLKCSNPKHLRLAAAHKHAVTLVMHSKGETVEAVRPLLRKKA